jgi:predicted nuclease of predicted toxin-antitoxin system
MTDAKRSNKDTRSTGEAHSTADALLLDEMFPGRLADRLRQRGHDVVAITDHPELRALSDADVYSWAAAHGRRILTENVKDFRPLLLQALEAGGPCAALLLSSSRTFPRSRKSPRPLELAIHAWFTQSRGTGVVEEWLQPLGRDQ